MAVTVTKVVNRASLTCGAGADVVAGAVQVVDGAGAALDDGTAVGMETESSPVGNSEVARQRWRIVSAPDAQERVSTSSGIW